MISVKQSLIEAKDVARIQWKSFSCAVVLLMAVYFASWIIPPGIVTWALCVPPGIIILLTAFARINDIGVEKMGLRWQARKIGLVMAGAGAVLVMASVFSLDVPPQWRTVVITWGFALAWLTTPEMPPWEDYISGKYRELKEYKHKDNFIGAFRRGERGGDSE